VLGDYKTKEIKRIYIYIYIYCAPHSKKNDEGQTPFTQKGGPNGH
jgi:hypothetical protein